MIMGAIIMGELTTVDQIKNAIKQEIKGRTRLMTNDSLKRYNPKSLSAECIIFQDLVDNYNFNALVHDSSVADTARLQGL
jgi:benzoyl-CoA reductase/2-hydroxyglutaryl-CoA dehydratase subunit BcrC/BadD/HgdB